MSIDVEEWECSDDEHEFYTVTIVDDEVLTMVTHIPTKVDSWISEIERIHHHRLNHLVVGLDVEWRPNFNRNIRNPVATIQLCVGRRCLIFQLIYAQSIPESLSEFLDNSDYTFVGVGIDGDVQKLWTDYGLGVSNTVDLRNLVVENMDRGDLSNAGLKVLAREVLGVEVEKPRRVTLSKWDNAYLTYEQVGYACADAFLSFEIGRSLNASEY